MLAGEFRCNIAWTIRLRSPSLVITAVDRPCLGVEVLGDGIVGVISSSSVVGLTAQEGALGGGVEQQASLSTRS